MTIKLGNLVDWRVLDGKSLAFAAPDFDKGRPRRLRLDLNSEFGCNWYIRFHRLPIKNMPEYVLGAEPVLGEPEVFERFFAFIPAGLETVEFTFGGDFELMPVRPDECEILYWTSEAEEYWVEGDGETFSTVYERQPRNEALEYVMFQASQNQLRRDKAHAAELAAIRAEIGAMNGRQSGIHGQPPAEHQEPAAEQRAAKAAAPKAVRPEGAGLAPAAGATEGEDETK
ncbi:hypothetical protein ACFFTN_15490 [Aminobacter aganoensis]|uniref:Uncharacterized protein n=1 Tax=Aminobacter aganoensis TaxID=83264 RepID=A0A7X0KMM0_9HYPH|nr:hypothetical protein [Aminobacter aganoensis]MBB6356280.1 hypothetical protein [Aminobacter aganoensis]